MSPSDETGSAASQTIHDGGVSARNVYTTQAISELAMSLSFAFLSGQVKTGQRWSWQNRPTEMAGFEVAIIGRIWVATEVALTGRKQLRSYITIKLSVLLQ